MLRNRVYYSLRPWLPQTVRLRIRRLLMKGKRAQTAKAWPICPGSETPPRNWPGWPGEKRFALILTHDVESPVGLQKCRELMKREMGQGFRSSFNFVPEGNYAVPQKLRKELYDNGFEIGVQDLHHDGRLYSSRQSFLKRAQRINRYLSEWGAVGFRSAFMLHNLDWMHDLNILYDASTFDTDPFEPQPDGLHTIFPIWIPRPKGVRSDSNQSNAKHQGYVELPYTLPQDSTLFLLLQEQQPDIWFKKLDWVAEHRGMALLNTHPDYMSFNGTKPNALEYPAQLYEQLLRRVQDRYGGAYWHAAPGEAAQYVLKMMAGCAAPAPSHRGRTLRPEQASVKALL